MSHFLSLHLKCKFKNNKYIKEGLSKGKPIYNLLKSGHWSMIYSNKLLQNKDIRYGNFPNGEDGIFLLKALLNANKVSFWDEVAYYYCVRQDGLSQIDKLERHLSSLKSLTERIKVLNSRGLDDEGYTYLTNYSRFVLNNFHKHINGNELEKKTEIAEFISKFEEAVNLTDNPSRIYDALPTYKELTSHL